MSEIADVILLDARMVGTRPHGIARYALGLVPALVAAAPADVFVVLVPRDLPKDSVIRAAGVVETAVRLYSVGEQILLPPLLRRLGPQLLHSLTYSAPLVSPAPVIPTIHDLVHLRFPQYHSAAHRLYYQHVVGPAARRAPRVITVSYASAQAIAETLRVDPRRIAVTPLAIERRFLTVSDEDTARVRARHNLPSEFLLYIGNSRPHKNASGALRIRNAVADEHGLDLPLVLVGVTEAEVAAKRLGKHPRRARAEIVSPSRSICFATFPDLDLPALYRAASVLLLPSLDEGFGLPALEAMATGTAVVASSRGALPEVMGDVGVLADPDDLPAFAENVARVLADTDLTASLRARGRVRAECYTWEKTARLTLAVYRAALADAR